MYWIFFCFPISIFGQQKEYRSTVFGLKSQAAFIIPHSKELREISETYPVGFQFDFSRLNLTQKAWEQCNCYSKVGLSFAYFNYRNPAQLGNSYNLILFAEPYLTFKRNIFFTFRTGAGITYLDQVYDETTNPENTFYSSPISFIVLLNLAINYQLTDKLNLNLTTHYNHISNGGIKHPNKGMNFPGIGLGLDYTVNHYSFTEWDKITVEKGGITGYGRIFVTRKTKRATADFPEETKLLFGLAGGIQMRVANFNALSSGMEIIRDNTLALEAKRREIDKAPYTLGAGIGHHFIFGRFNFNQQLMYYVHKPFDFTNKKFYQRYELAYQLNEYLMAGVSLKAHGHVAENFDLRIGVEF